MRTEIMAMAVTTFTLLACSGFQKHTQRAVGFVADDRGIYSEEAKSLLATSGTTKSWGAIDAQPWNYKSDSSDTFDSALRGAFIGLGGVLMLVVGFWYLLNKTPFRGKLSSD